MTQLHSKLKHKNHIPAFMLYVILLFIFGAMIGCIAGHIFQGQVYSPLMNLYEMVVTHLKDSDIDRNAIVTLSAKKHLKLFALLWFFSITNVWKYYFAGFSLYIGIINGLLLAFCTTISGISGIGDYLCYLLPQALIFIPVYLFTIYRCQLFHQNFLANDSSYCSPSESTNWNKKGQLFIHQLPFLIVMILFLLLGCFFEGYLNVPLLRFFLSA